jgi:hypothetical protein
MDSGDIVWGAALIVGGIFVGIYGDMLFRFVLAVIGFLLGFSAVYLLLDGKSQGLQILMSIIVGGIAALVLYSLIKFGLYIAGAALGAVIGVVLAAIVGLSTSGSDWLGLLFILVGAGGIGFLGPRLGAMIIPLSTSAVAGLMVTYGYGVWFQSTFNLDTANPDTSDSRKSLIVLFAIVTAISFLGQWNISKLRRRLRGGVGVV